MTLAGIALGIGPVPAMGVALGSRRLRKRPLPALSAPSPCLGPLPQVYDWKLKTCMACPYGTYAPADYALGTCIPA